MSGRGKAEVGEGDDHAARVPVRHRLLCLDLGSGGDLARTGGKPLEHAARPVAVGGGGRRLGPERITHRSSFFQQIVTDLLKIQFLDDPAYGAALGSARSTNFRVQLAEDLTPSLERKLVETLPTRYGLALQPRHRRAGMRSAGYRGYPAPGSALYPGSGAGAWRSCRLATGRTPASTSRRVIVIRQSPRSPSPPA